MSVRTAATAAPPHPPSPLGGRVAPRSGPERLATTGLLALTALAYLWNLSANGWGNAFYAGAVQAMTKNWTAFFFGSADAGNTITVDKPPASLWVMALSARVFGLSSWSVLVPQALMGVAAVALLVAAVRRVSGPVAGLVAGLVLALTPVAVLMFRFDNPDAMLVLLLVAAAYAVVRALEGARTRWLLLAGALVGLAFLTKTAQALLPVPALALAYLWAAPTGLGRRIRQLLATGAALVVASGWWFAAAALWPAGSRPYIGGSTNGSAWQLAIGYNGLGRLFGEGFGGGAGGVRGALPEGAAAAYGAAPGAAPGAVQVAQGNGAVVERMGGFGGGGGGFGADAGWLRMFGSSVGGQVAWLLPAALLLLVAGVVLTRRLPRTDRVRASLVVWGGWTLVTAVTFSLMEGTFHQYYTVALAPGIAGLVGVGGAALWRRRDRAPWRAVLAVVVATTAVWSWVLLGRSADFVPWLRWVVLVAGCAAALGLLVRGARVAIAALATAVVVASLGPAAYAVETVRTAHTGSIPLAGPETAGGGFGGGRGAGGFPGGTAPGGTAPGGTAPGGTGGTGGAGGTGGGTGGGTTPGGTGGTGGMGGGQVSDDLVALLQAAGTDWSAATTSTSSSAELALASGTDVMGIGGFTGSDPAPTLARFQELVADGRIHYYVPGRGGPGGSSEIGTWVAENYTATTAGGQTVYDLTQPVS
ncbi:ArnT family glycosyltransferase [Kineococcus glutinatus]|uniref:4-amino-4-deoxy-L-arabinose transferase-like glycosyltransferase n=1 Tax=Kineococcus glutinatus TaxID=1070872 RepID=A0ABP9HEF4_9ACTN